MSMTQPQDAPPPLRLGSVCVRAGIVLRTGLWPAAQEPARGSVLLLGGQAEFLEKYARVAAHLQGAGLCVGSFDWRGQGGSTRLLRASSRGAPRGHVTDFGAYLEDLHAYLAGSGHALPAPRYLLAHSMGGHVALRWLADRPQAVCAGVLTSPMLGMYTGGWPQAAARVGARLARRLGLGGLPVPGAGDLARRRQKFAGNPYTADPALHAWVREVQREHPELCVQGVTLGWLAAAYDSLSALHAPGVAQRITTPLTLLLAGDERVADTPAARAFAARLPAARLREIPGARHELLMEGPAVQAQLWAEVAQRFGVPALAGCGAADAGPQPGTGSTPP